MKCPHCNNGFFEDWEENEIFNTDPNNQNIGSEIHYCQCPSCLQLIIKLKTGILSKGSDQFISECLDEKLVFPSTTSRRLEPEIPTTYASEFKESESILYLSPKASAAISRRLLQNILCNEYKLKDKQLVNQIHQFISKPGVPSHLIQAIDAIRNIGNFAAHPMKNNNTGEIVEVELGEAEWLLDVLEALFDFTFIQPIKLQQNIDKLNQKLKGIGKPPMK